MLIQGPRLDFQSGGAKNIIVTKEAQPWFAPTGKFFNFDLLSCLKTTLFQTDLDQKWGEIHKWIMEIKNSLPKGGGAWPPLAPGGVGL